MWYGQKGANITITSIKTKKFKPTKLPFIIEVVTHKPGKPKKKDQGFLSKGRLVNIKIQDPLKVKDILDSGFLEIQRKKVRLFCLGEV